MVRVLVRWSVKPLTARKRDFEERPTAISRRIDKRKVSCWMSNVLRDVDTLQLEMIYVLEKDETDLEFVQDIFLI